MTSPCACRSVAVQKVRVKVTNYERSKAPTLLMSNWSDEKTNGPLIADDRNFYKVENWTKDSKRIEHMLCVGNPRVVPLTPFWLKMSL
jgi:hypothetical protein